MSRFEKLKKLIEKKGNVTDAGAVTASIMRNKYKKSDIIKHQQNGTSMEHVKPKKKQGKE